MSLYIAVIENSEIKSSIGITTNSMAVGEGGLEVSGPSSFTSNVFIDSSLSVHGSVMGSGPYMDSSDSRFKRDIRSLPSNSLDLIMKFDAKTYYYDTKMFKDRKFSGAQQIGWMADDIQKLVPELVEEDNDGFKHLSYSRSSVLIAEAVKELTKEYRYEIQSLRDRIVKLEEIAVRRDIKHS